MIGKMSLLGAFVFLGWQMTVSAEDISIKLEVPALDQYEPPVGGELKAIRLRTRGKEPEVLSSKVRLNLASAKNIAVSFSSDSPGEGSLHFNSPEGSYWRSFRFTNGEQVRILPTGSFNRERHPEWENIVQLTLKLYTTESSQTSTYSR